MMIATEFDSITYNNAALQLAASKAPDVDTVVLLVNSPDGRSNAYFPTGHTTGGTQAATMVFGVFLGSALWWLGLSTMVSSVRHKLSAKTMQSINRLSGAILLAFAVYQLSTLLPG